MRRVAVIATVLVLLVGSCGCKQETTKTDNNTTTTAIGMISGQERVSTTVQGDIANRTTITATKTEAHGSTTVTTHTVTGTTRLSGMDLPLSAGSTTAVSGTDNDAVNPTTTEVAVIGTTVTTKAAPTVGEVTRATVTTPQQAITTDARQTITSAVHQSNTTKSVSTALPTTTAWTKPMGPTPLTALDPEMYYGYVLLGNERNGSQLQAVYRRLAAGVEAMDTAITVNDESVHISGEDLNNVWSYYRLDYPQHFWVDSRFSYEIKGDQITAMPSYRMDKEERDSRRADMEKTVMEILSEVSGSWSEYERELAIHDALCERLTYRENGPASHNADGALVDGEAVCEGYAESFQYLLYRAGIQCLGVIGTSHNEDHKWNVVRLDGSYYHVDITWDDPVGVKPTVSHGYLNISEALLKRDHRVDQEGGYPLPACQVTTYNYFKQNGGWLTDFSVDEVAAHLRHNSGKAEFYLVEKTAEQFVDWFDENAYVIKEKAGAESGYSLSIGEFTVTVDMT